MIRMVASASAGHAKSYFSDALSKADYYTNDQELQGTFAGKLAERLGLSGPADKKAFFDLCENRHPNTGKNLTPRTKKDRTIGYDINFHCPKSVSVIHVLAKDNHVLNAFEESVAETMRDIEAEVQTRVRKGGKYEDRITGEMIWAHFTHQTARPVGNEVPDPHLHAHAFALNVTYDDVEKRYKAAKFKDINAEMPFYQTLFHKRLSDKLIALGYQVKQTAQSFEIEGVPQPVIDLFSKRTDEIGRVAKEKGITDAKEMDGLGARTRSKKQKGLSMEELKDDWQKQIRQLSTPPENSEKQQKEELAKPVRYAPEVKVQQGKLTTEQVRNAKDCIDYAISHCFERESVVTEKRLLKTAFTYSVGHSSISMEEIARVFKKDERILRVMEDKKQLCTTKAVLQEEKRMVDLARNGVGKMQPLYRDEPKMNAMLNDQQAAAIGHILTTQNQVSIVRGAAGTGKTTLMREAVHHIQQAGKQVVVVAPTANASRGVLKQEGFEHAETVAKLLVDKQMQESLKDGVLWVDEAGLLGTKDMAGLLALAKEKNTRVILGGDTRQHTSVVRGDALRILNKVGGIRPAEVNKIFRQMDQHYREAVVNLSNGDVKQAFEKLNKIGAIQQVDRFNANEKLVTDYVSAIRQNKTALVISPTHKQGEAVTADIRLKLREAGLLGKKEILVPKLVGKSLTEAEKGDWRNFEEGLIVQFNQNVQGIKRGSLWRVKNTEERNVRMVNGTGQTITLPRDRASTYEVFEKKEMALSKGDKVQIKRNGFDERGSRLNNGQELTVASIDKKGKILLRNDNSKMIYELDHRFGHLDHSHCVTSHASQGKTVDKVFISQPAATFPATDARQFYVSVSRGRETVSIYTDDKEALLDHASDMGNRQSALELVNSKNNHMEHVHHMTRMEPVKTEKIKTAEKVEINRTIYKERDYEPII